MQRKIWYIYLIFLTFVATIKISMGLFSDKHYHTHKIDNSVHFPDKIEIKEQIQAISSSTITVTYWEREHYIKIHTTTVFIDKDDLEWLIDVLQAVVKLHSETNEK